MRIIFSKCNHVTIFISSPILRRNLKISMIQNLFQEIHRSSTVTNKEDSRVYPPRKTMCKKHFLIWILCSEFLYKQWCMVSNIAVRIDEHDPIMVKISKGPQGDKNFQPSAF